METFLIATIVFALIAWVADKWIPAPFGRIFAIVMIVIWLFRYVLPFLGFSF